MKTGEGGQENDKNISQKTARNSPSEGPGSLGQEVRGAMVEAGSQGADQGGEEEPGEESQLGLEPRTGLATLGYSHTKVLSSSWGSFVFL